MSAKESTRHAKPTYYVFTNTSRNQSEAAFYRYDTPQEAMSADIVKRVEGVTVLMDDFKRTYPWRDNPAMLTVAEEASKRLEATWRIDRELVGTPILISQETINR